ncbi:MAG TPA: O-antigen ligase family protein [Nevskia sp.]|nr:O-antigen ligase family protein [Nevskia sp.]
MGFGAGGMESDAFMRAAQAGAAAPRRLRWIRDDRHAVLLGLMVWALVVLMIVPDDFDYSALSNPNAPAAGGLVSRLTWLLLLVGGLAVIARRRELAGQLWRHLNPWLALFALLAAASVAWSIEPDYTVRRMVRVLTFIVDGCALALMAWHPRRLQQVLRPIVTLMLAGSLLFGLLQPQLAIHQETSPELLGAWRGLANHKNSFGALACLGMILWFHAGLAGETKRWRAMAGLTLAAACLVLSRSSTSLVAAAFSLVLLGLVQRPTPWLRRHIPLAVTLFGAGLTAYALIVLRVLPGISLLFGPVSALTGKDMSMTGRADIWQLISEHIAQRPLLGSGYGAYWTGLHPGTDSYAFVQNLGFYPGSSHNGYLEVFNDLGLAGGICLAGFIVVCLRQSLRLLRSDADQAALFLALFLQELVVNLSESHWFSVLSVNFAVITLATAALARSLLEQRLRLCFGEPDLGAPPLKVAPLPALDGESHAQA